MAALNELERAPVKAKVRRGPPSPGEMILLAVAVRDGGVLVLDHKKGKDRPVSLDATWDMVDRGWFSGPQAPELPSPTIRRWRFEITDAGRRAYAGELETFK